MLTFILKMKTFKCVYSIKKDIFLATFYYNAVNKKLAALWSQMDCTVEVTLLLLSLFIAHEVLSSILVYVKIMTLF